jgi:hypothetical protein
MRRSPLIFISVALLLGIAVAGVFYYRYRHSPRFALQQLVVSLTNRNYDQFYDSVDLPGVMSHLMAETGRDLVPPELPTGDFLSQFGWKMGGKVARQLIPRLFETFDKELRKLLNQYFETLGPQEFVALNAAVALADINQQGEQAQVTLKFPKKDGRLRLTMSWNPQLGRWRVVAVNYEDLKHLVKKELW